MWKEYSRTALLGCLLAGAGLSALSSGCDSQKSDEGAAGQAGASNGGGSSDNSTETRGQKRYSDDPEVAVRGSLTEMARKLSGVCSEDYEGDPDAPHYDPLSPGPHPVLTLNAAGEPHSWNEGIPEAWLPKKSRDVELVVCVEPTDEWRKKTCEYVNGPNVHLYARTTDLVLVSVHSGERYEDTISDGNGRRCPSTRGLSELYSDAPGPEHYMKSVLDFFVPLPDCYPERPVYGCFSCRESKDDVVSSGCTGEDADSHTRTRRLPSVEVGHTVSLNVGDDFPDSYLDSRSPPFDRQELYSYDWAESLDYETLPENPGRNPEVLVEEERRYEYIVNAKVPGVDGDPTLDRIELSFNAIVRRPPAELSHLGTPRPGVQQTLKAHQGSTPPRFCGWEITRKPAGSEFEITIKGDAIELGVGADVEAKGCSVAFVPDMPGDYQFAAAHYYDDVGYSELVESEVITIFASPVVEVLASQVEAPFPTALRLEADVTHEIGTLEITVAVISAPEGEAPEFRRDTGITAEDVAYDFLPKVAGEYEVELVVTDRHGASEPFRFQLTSTPD